MSVVGIAEVRTGGHFHPRDVPFCGYGADGRQLGGFLRNWGLVDVYEGSPEERGGVLALADARRGAPHRGSESEGGEEPEAGKQES